MIYNAISGNIKIDNTYMDYVAFGKGSKNLIMIPGLGDGLKTVKGMAIPFSMLYRQYAKKYRVYVFSRRNKLVEGYSTRDMAKDQVMAMKELNITKADIIGISQGGMIAQYIAIDYPEVVHKLVLAVTLSKQNEMVREVVRSWVQMALKDDYKSLMLDTAEKTYSDKYLKKNRWMYTILSRIGKPKDFSRFYIMANSCINHNAYSELNTIKCPTYVIGADNDKVVGGEASKEINDCIKNSKLFIYKGLGHGAYEEAKDFNSRVLTFLTE